MQARPGHLTIAACCSATWWQNNKELFASIFGLALICFYCSVCCIDSYSHTAPYQFEIIL